MAAGDAAQKKTGTGAIVLTARCRRSLSLGVRIEGLFTTDEPTGDLLPFSD